MRRSEIKTTYGGKSCCVSRAYVTEDHHPTTFWATLRGWQLLTDKKKKKCTVEEAKGLFLRKSTILTFLSTTHSTPPPHPLVFPPASPPFHISSPALLPLLMYHASHTCFPLCVLSWDTGSDTSRSDTTLEEEPLCMDLELPLSSEGEIKPASFLCHSSKCVSQNMHSLFRSPVLTPKPQRKAKAPVSSAK